MAIAVLLIARDSAASTTSIASMGVIEGKNATDAAAFDWLQTRKARFKWTCLVRRLRALGIGLFARSKVFLSGRLRPGEAGLCARDRGGVWPHGEV